jgi:hypothetical protein
LCFHDAMHVDFLLKAARVNFGARGANPAGSRKKLPIDLTDSRGLATRLAIECDPYLTIAIGSFPASKISYRVPSTVTCTQK